MCEKNKFVVFRTEIDLKKHRLDLHQGDMSRAASREIRKVELEFNNNSGRRDSERSEGGRERREERREERRGEETPDYPEEGPGRESQGELEVPDLSGWQVAGLGRVRARQVEQPPVRSREEEFPTLPTSAESFVKQKGQRMEVNNFSEKTVQSSSQDLATAGNEIEKKIQRVRDVLKENEELKTKIKTKETELFHLRSSSEKDVGDIKRELDTIETEQRLSVEVKTNAEQEIQRLEEIINDHRKVIDNCDRDISRIEQKKTDKERMIKVRKISVKVIEDDLTEEIRNLRSSLDSRIKAVDNLMREGVTESVSSEKQRIVSFLSKTIKEKEEAIKEKESDLECPVCLETAGGQIFSCTEQHLVCSQCRPRVRKCPQCRQSYPPTPLRHRYAEKSVRELQRLREEVGQMVLELKELTD